MENNCKQKSVEGKITWPVPCSIPNDLLPDVLSNLEVHERFRLCVVCRRWRDVVRKIPIPEDEDYPKEAYPVVGRLIKHFYRCRCNPLGNFHKQMVIAKTCTNLESLSIDTNVQAQESNWVALNTWFRNMKKVHKMMVVPPNEDSQNCYGTLFYDCVFPRLKTLVIWQYSPDLCPIQREFYKERFGEVFPELTDLVIYLKPEMWGCDYHEYDLDFSNPLLLQKTKEIYETVMSWFSEEVRSRKSLSIYMFDFFKNTFTPSGVEEMALLFPDDFGRRG